ncbi:MAG TPA: type II toxin-antitoxin system HicB family antitoxin [Anaerolineales bacterium]|nr:type II toxin-antitoxin system HicB family antitoxin [Anaerolineales bacterium]
MEKDLDYYLKLPYTIELIPDSEQGWFVRVKELRGCMSQGDTVQEAYEMIQDAMQGWLEVAIEDNIPIPEPALDEDYSGKFVVRLPRSLHRQLAETAEREGVSLNQFVNVALARAVEQVNPGAAYPIAQQSSQFAVKEKKAKYHRGKKKR